MLFSRVSEILLPVFCRGSIEFYIPLSSSPWKRPKKVPMYVCLPTDCSTWPGRRMLRIRLIALVCAGLRDVLVNLDADNCIGESFCSFLIDGYRSASIQGIHAKGFEPGTCGRVSLRVATFKYVQGYDQESDVMPSGYQDIDIKARVVNAFQKDSSKPHNLVPPMSVPGRKHAPDYHKVIGCALQNDPDAKRDRTTSKIVNTHNPRGLKWCNMNDINMKLMKQKLRDRGPIRNEDTYINIYIYISKYTYLNIYIYIHI